MTTFSDDAALDGFSRGWSRFLAWYPLLGTVALGVVYALRKGAYYWLLLDDHPIEWAQFAFLVFAFLIAVSALVRFVRTGRLRQAAVMALAAVFCFGFAGEEISWGQRVFSLATPAALKDNAQGETTLHNMHIGILNFDKISDATELAIGLAGGVLALLARSRRGTLLAELAPPLVAVPGFVLTALYWAFMLATSNGTSPAALYKQWAEICLYLGIVLTITCVYTRAAAGRYATTATGGTAHRPLDPGAPDPGARAGRWPLIAAAVAAVALMGVFAQLSAQSRVLPGNVPPSLVSLYGAL